MSSALNEVQKFNIRADAITRSLDVPKYKNYIFYTGQAVFGRNLYVSQVEAVYHLMIHSKLLLAMKTGSGKSAVFHLSAILLRGVTLLVGPLLALMADQYRKARELSSPFGKVHCFNLDQIKSSDQVSQVVTDLCSITKDTDDTYFLFASPQTLPRFLSVLKLLRN